MERILVAIDTRHGAWAALSHACFLARRMDVELYVLLVNPLPGEGKTSSGNVLESTVKKRLSLLLETAKAQGISINYFVTEGTYEDEVIQFVKHYRIGLLVFETKGSETRMTAKEATLLGTLRHRLRCKIEVVAANKSGPTPESLRLG